MMILICLIVYVLTIAIEFWLEYKWLSCDEEYSMPLSYVFESIHPLMYIPIVNTLLLIRYLITNYRYRNGY